LQLPVKLGREAALRKRGAQEQRKSKEEQRRAKKSKEEQRRAKKSKEDRVERYKAEKLGHKYVLLMI
jgi:hypothetical protein